MMSICDEVSLLKILTLAERELAAFLEATSDLLGIGGRSFAADIWLGIMESLPWPDDGLPEFFRAVSIQAISQIVVGSLANLTAPPIGIESSHRLLDLRLHYPADVLDLSEAIPGRWYDHPLLVHGRSN